MVENNACGGCNACCKFVNFTVNREQKERDFPETTEVDSMDQLRSKASRREPGTFSFSYYEHGSELQLARIVANEKCPKNDEAGNCTIYPDRPDDCRRLRRGGSECNYNRAEIGLSEIR